MGRPATIDDLDPIKRQIETLQRNIDKVAADLAPKALVVITRERQPATGSGQAVWTSSEQTGDEWMAAMRSNSNPVIFREPLTNVTVTIDSDHLAHVRADFQVMRDGKAVSHGVDQFTLVREPSGWKFVFIAYTSISEK